MKSNTPDVSNGDSTKSDWLANLPDNGRRSFEEAVRNHSAGKYEEALNFYAMALSYAPDESVILSNIGVLLRSQGKFKASEECYRRALAIDPESPGCWTNLGNVLRRLGKLKEAAYCHRKAFKIDKEFIDAYYNLALVLQDMGKLDESIKNFDFCLKAKPGDARINWDKALALLAKGDFINGFEGYEYRWQRGELRERHFKQPLWDGSPLNGKRILLYSEQGFGDTLHLCRYVSEVAKAGGKVIFECQTELVSLLKGLNGLDKIVSSGDKLPEFDVQASLLSLPLIFKHEISTVPSACPYITPPADSGFPVHVPPGTKYKVGIVWAGKATHKNDHNRSVSVENFFVFSRIPGVMLYSLQKGGPSIQRDEFACGFLVRDLAAGCSDFADTAKVMKQLDLIITVDTSVAHLAGALGIPVFVALPYNPDWRWMRERPDSPWYPSMTLFRQQEPGNWDHVFNEMLSVLTTMVSE
ncbi:tetratricopeptide repeat protein [Maridesulfovibrio frigidus]|uniref:tetratricopeptide repeat-containing glycosyltransferase family protein n=1 Tax=Maridesulfovibrio frigidus TaxID=340956 RepID=UPI0004E27A43|nr:tetratricopeptide repeat-containing glycosyltransferase family protein [Maridesulfovibrio frigidus]